MATSTLCVDGNWILHRAAYTAQPEFVAARYLTMVCKAATDKNLSNITVCFDGAKVFRYALDKEYKANRVKKDGISPNEYLGEVKATLANHGIQFIHLPEYEADDVLCSIARTTDVMVLTGDKDHLQYLRPGVTIINPYLKGTSKPTSVRHTDIPKMFGGLQVHQLVDYQTLVGDKVDNVPKVVTPSVAIKGLLKHGSLQGWLRKDEDLQQHVARLRLNRKLVRLVPDIEVQLLKTKKVEATNKQYVEFMKGGSKASALF